MINTGYGEPDDSGLEINGIKRFIVCAANRYGDTVVIGVRHFCPLMRQNLDGVGSNLELRILNQGSGLNPVTCQGFIDQFGHWLSREEALHIAEANGQYINYERNGSTTELFSEGLYSIK